MTTDEIARLRKVLADSIRLKQDFDFVVAFKTDAPALLDAAERVAALEAALREALTNTVTRTSKELGPEGSTLCEHPKCSAWARPGETLPHDASCPLANGTSALDSALAAARRDGAEAMRERAAKHAETWTGVHVGSKRAQITGFGEAAASAIRALPLEET